jgi:hypothetical protein
LAARRNEEIEPVRKTAVYTAILSALAIAGLTGQTPTQSLPTKPLRSLSYNFQVDYQQNGETHTDAIGTGGSGVKSMLNGIGRTGALNVDILGLGNDGGLVIRVSEWLQYQPRASQSFTCAAYPDGRVVCPEELQVTDAENTLMGFLGRGFYDPTLVDAQHQWQRSYSNKYVSVVSTFTITGPPDANPLNISSKSEIKSMTGAFSNWNDQAQLTYDTALEVPLHVHDVALQIGRQASSVQTTTEITLTKDSFAKPAVPSSK